MKTYKYRKIDAFTTGRSLGNPAACIYLEWEQSLSDSEMLDIAKQHKSFVSEVVYCSQKSQFSFNLVYYSSECEVDFCGHGTIACMYNLIKENPNLLNQREIEIHTNKKGSLIVYNEVQMQDSVYITAPMPRYIGTNICVESVVENLQMNSRQISNVFPIDIIDAGLKTLIVPISTLEEEINIFPNELVLKQFCIKNDIDIVLIYSLEVENKQNKAHTRVFAPKFGYLEDPATGSGNSAFGYYMLKNNLWNGDAISIEQGGIDRIFNTVNLMYKDNIVLFGGKATTRIKGDYYIGT